MRFISLLFACAIVLGGCAHNDVSPDGAKSTPREASSWPGRISALPIDGLERYQELRRMQAASDVPVAERRRRAEEIAKRSAQRYRDTAFLALVFHSFEWPQRCAVIAMRMAPNKLRSEVYLDRYGWEQPVLVYTMSDGMFREWNLIPGYEQYAEYTASAPIGSAGPRVDEGSPAYDYRCMTGSSVVTWIGPEAAETIGRVYPGRAALGEWIGQVDLLGHRCDVVLWDGDLGDERMAAVFYFGPDDYLRGYDTFDVAQDGGVQLVRQRRYTNLSLSAPPGKWWEYEPAKRSSAE